MNSPPTGIDRNLTHYADPGFSRYLRRAFLASAGYDEVNILTQIKYKQSLMASRSVETMSDRSDVSSI